MIEVSINMSAKQINASVSSIHSSVVQSVLRWEVALGSATSIIGHVQSVDGGLASALNTVYGFQDRAAR